MTGLLTPKSSGKKINNGPFALRGMILVFSYIGHGIVHPGMISFFFFSPKISVWERGLNPFATGNPFLGTKFLEFSVGRGSGALKGLSSRIEETLKKKKR